MPDQMFAFLGAPRYNLSHDNPINDTTPECLQHVRGR